MQQLSIRRGDTLYVECQLVDEFGADQSIAGIQVQATLIDKGGFVTHTFGVTTISESQGKYALAEFNTGSIPKALYTLQISYTRNGAIISSTAFELNVCMQMGVEPVRFAQLASVIGNTRVLITVPGTEAEVYLWSSEWDVQWA